MVIRAVTWTFRMARSWTTYMPTPDPNKVPGVFEAKTRPGLFLGRFRQPGGKWSGDYLVADFESFRFHLDITPGKASIHRAKEIIKTAWCCGDTDADQAIEIPPWRFPMAEFRQKLTMNVHEDPSAVQPELPATRVVSDGAPCPDMRG